MGNETFTIMKKILFGFVTLALLAACSNDALPDVGGVDSTTDKPVVVNAGVDRLVTRVGMTTEELATLGLSIYNPNSTRYSYENVKYVKSGTMFVAAGGQAVPYWQNKTQQVRVTAYAPYMENWTGDFAVQADQSTTDAAKASDLLWAQEMVEPAATTQTGNITYSNESLNINLRHKFSKLVVNLRYLNEVALDVKAQSLTVKYLSTGCTIAPESGTITNLGTPADIVAYKETSAAEGYKDCFEAIFPPQNMAFKLLLLLDNGQDFEYYSSAFDFNSGIAHVFNLTVGKHKVELDEITVKRWDEVAGGELETDDKSPDNNKEP